MTPHGLWRVHRAIRYFRKGCPDFDWCRDTDRISRIMYWWNQGKPRHADLVRSCLERYGRRYGIRTVAEWNALVDRICDRAGFTYATRKAARILARPNARVCYVRANTKFWQWEVSRRRDNIQKIRERRVSESWDQIMDAENDLKHIRHSIRLAQAAIKQRAMG